MRGALDRFFHQAPCSLFANDPVGDICSTYESPSRGLASHGPASPEEQDYLEPLPLNSWVCTTHHHHPGDESASEGLPSSVSCASRHWSIRASDSSTFAAKAVVLWKRGL